MSLYARLNCILVAGFALAMVAADQAYDFGGPSAAFGTFFILSALNWLVVRRAVWKWMWRRGHEQLRRAFADDDAAEALRAADWLGRQSPTRAAREMFAANRAIALLLDERWTESMAAIKRLDGKLLTPGMMVAVGNAFAWALTHVDEHEQAVTLARDLAAAVRTDKAAAAVAAPCIGTYGVALVRAGQPELGLVQLRESMALGGNPRTQATRLLYIGDAERALGREAEARAAWEEAARIAPQMRFGRRAAERLKSASPVPYR